MSHRIDCHPLKKRVWIGLALFLTVMSQNLLGATVDKVTTYRDSNGWKLKVNGEDFYVKGMVWGYTPRNENYKFNLWGLPDENVKNILDYEFGLMKQAGVNAVRLFATIPPKWISYINDTYGIKTAINPLMGRYGATIDGVWVESPDYSDARTREALKNDVLRTVEKYKDVPGVLMFALGNESNYGLSWKSFEIENLPVGEQQAGKAKYLYSLFAETIAAGQQIDPNHPFTIVNGDIQYIDLISKYGKNWGVLGVNAYRGKSFTELWKDVKAGPDLPVLFFEFGSDAFNAKTMKEDQLGQATYLRDQWEEMYANSYGQGYGNSIGGFVFEWRDEWWKYRNAEVVNLNRHDTNASWENGGYEFDHVPGQNNMNEEWFGVTRLGEINSDGIYVAEPRLAYDVLKEIWKVDPYATGSVQSSNSLQGIDMGALSAQVEERDSLNGWGAQQDAFRLVGGEIILDARYTDYDTANPEPGKKKSKSDFGQMAFLDFEFQLSRNISGDFTINVIGDATNSDFLFKYGDRVIDENDPHVEIYDFQGSYTGEYFDLHGFYHVPRYHWGYKGDFFGLMRETTDMDGPNGQDIWNAKAPFGVEFVGKEALDGLTIAAGSEIYWGANPKVLLKYQFGSDKQYTFMHSEDYDQAESGESSPTATASRKTSQSTLQGKFNLAGRTTLEIGGIISGLEKDGDDFDYIEDGEVFVDEIEFEDTLGVKARLAFDLIDNARAYIVVNYAGLVANAGEPLKELGPTSTNLPYSEYGNKKEIEAGVRYTSGDYSIYPRALYRDNIVEANPVVEPYIDGTVLYPGTDPRNTNSDPFAVLGNREARSAEVYLTYDPTPSTPFYDWDNDLREDAKFAYNVGLTVTRFGSATDAALFFYEPLNIDVPFATGLPSEEVWVLKSKVVLNPSYNLKVILKTEAGRQQPTELGVEADGSPVEPTDYVSIEGKFIINRQHILKASFKKDAWGTYDFQREFNVKYPEQIELGYVRLLDKGLGETESSQLGIKAFYRTIGEYSTEYLNGVNDYMYEIQAYFSYKF